MHTHLDDLESFYYVLLYIILLFEAPDKGFDESSSLLSTWGGS